MRYLITGDDGSKSYERKTTNLAAANVEAHDIRTGLEPHPMAKVIIYHDDQPVAMWVGGESKRWAKAVI